MELENSLLFPVRREIICHEPFPSHACSGWGKGCLQALLWTANYDAVDDGIFSSAMICALIFCYLSNLKIKRMKNHESSIDYEALSIPCLFRLREKVFTGDVITANSKVFDDWMFPWALICAQDLVNYQVLK